MTYTPSGAYSDVLPWLAFSIAWAFVWIAIIVAVRGPPEHEPLRRERW